MNINKCNIISYTISIRVRGTDSNTHCCKYIADTDIYFFKHAYCHACLNGQ